jgi:hypothetical protein
LAENSTVQVESSFVAVVRSGASVHGFGTTVGIEPAGWLVNVKPTVPCGGLFVPPETSVTVIVHDAGAFAGVDAGQLTAVEVARAVTAIVSLPELPLWADTGAGAYVAVIV